MNYLKAIANINDARDIIKSEQQYQSAKADAIRIIKKLADDMYAIELDRAQYEVWNAIANLCDSLSCQN